MNTFIIKVKLVTWNLYFKNKVGQRTQKQGGTQHTIFKKSCGMGSNALHETEARSLLRHRATMHHSILRQLRLDSSNRYFC